MSVATKQATVRFSPKAGTYTTIIQSPSGDLYQEFEGSVGAIGAISLIFPDTTAAGIYCDFIPCGGGCFGTHCL